MAGKKKNQKKSSSPPSGDALRREVERLIGKEHYKDAVKQAKIGYRDEATGENHRLLERAYLLRARQLQRAGMPKSAAEVAGNLVEFGVTDPALIEEIAQLLLALGMSREADSLLGRVESPEARARLSLVAADQAVLHPDRMGGAAAETRQGAAMVRAALEAVEAGDEARAMESLREVARGSPFADWKLFARGLAAFRRREAPEADANWDRLDPGRPASRIARALRGTTAAPPGAPADDGGAARPARVPDFSALERHAFGEPVLAPLARVRDLVAQDRWFEAVRELGPIRHALRRLDPALAERLTRILLSALIRETERLDFDEAESLVGNFTRLAEPLAIDPNWNRLRALIWEGPQADISGALVYWGQYLGDLRESSALSPDERGLAQALVWKHLAVLNLDEAEDLEEPAGPFPFPGRSRPVSGAVADARRGAVQCLEESIRLAPAHLPTYEMLLRLRQGWDQPEEAAAAARRLLEAFPDHVDTLVFLADHHLGGHEPEKGLEYARRARALRPLDPDMAGLEWERAHVMLARHLALRGRFDEGRAEFEAADRVHVDPANRYQFLARRAVFELKAGRADLAERLIHEARGLLAEPGPLWLLIEIEASRYDLPKADRDRFAALGKAARKGRCRGETAGRMAEVLENYLATDVDYPGRAQHIREVVEYLRRATRVKYAADDLGCICTFLGNLPDEAPLLDKMLRRALKEFPNDPHFQFLAGTIEIKKGPFRCNLGMAKRHYEKALTLAQASGKPRAAELLPKVKEGLALIESLTTGSLGTAFAGFPGFAGKNPTLDDIAELFGGIEFDELYDDDDDDLDDDDYFDGGGPPIDVAPPPAKGRRPAPKRRRR